VSGLLAKPTPNVDKPHRTVTLENDAELSREPKRSAMNVSQGRTLVRKLTRIAG
jgi:hypothetical protein